MRPTRFRATLAVLLLLFAGTIALWIDSYRVGYYVTFSSGINGSHISVARGNLRIVWQGGWLGPNGEPVFTLPIRQVGEYSMLGSIYVPLLCVLMVEGVAVLVISLRLRDPGDANFCNICHYNLTGNTSGTCPECGRAVPMSFYNIRT